MFITLIWLAFFDGYDTDKAMGSMNGIFSKTDVFKSGLSAWPRGLPLLLFS